MSAEVLWPIGLGILGVVFGSFAAVLAVRWPAGRAVSRGRSACDGCDRTLRVVELVPIASWIVLRGRCRTCNGRIGAVHPLCELLGGAIGVSAGYIAPGVAGAAGAVFGWQLLALGAIDLRAFWLPDRLTLPLAATGLLTGIAGIGQPLVDRLFGGVAGFAALALAAAGYRASRGRTGLGGGDPKLFGAIGCWLGWRALPPVMLLACVLGLSAVLVARYRGVRMTGADRLPLGTLLATAAFAWWCVNVG